MHNDPPQKIIVLEKDPTRKGYLKAILSEEGFIAFSFDTIASCFENIDQLSPDLIVIGPQVGGYAIHSMNALAAIGYKLPVLLISDDQHLREYIAVNRLNNVDFTDNTSELPVFIKAVKIRLKKGASRDLDTFSSYLVGNSPQLIRIKKLAAKLGALNESVLISGEPGTGKEAVARAIHGLSHKNIGSFIKVNVAELNRDRSFSLLFEINTWRSNVKHHKDANSRGKIDCWTIYLDEIGLLPDHLQAELLLITGNQNDDVRVLAGTSLDMEILVTENRFRKDLYYRLNVLNFKMPPLRQRKEDIVLLADFFSYKLCHEFGKDNLLISERLKELLLHYDWPGNVKELQRIVKRAVLKGENSIDISMVKIEAQKHTSQLRKKWNREIVSIEKMTHKKEYLSLVGEMALKNICSNFMANIEKHIMLTTLEATNWNRKKAAAMLKISYKSMLNKIKRYELA